MMRRKVGKLLGDRRVVGGFLLLIQLAIVMFGVSWASTEYHWLTPALTVLSVIIVIWLVRKYDNPMYKITWDAGYCAVAAVRRLVLSVLGQYAAQSGAYPASVRAETAGFH